MTLPMPMTTAELLERLQRHYIKPGELLPGGVFVPECGWNGGPYGGGCDAIYVGFTTTSGRLLVGHELKVSRSDWLNELNKPGKADAWADECHQWWLVVSDASIVHDGELPASWGLMAPGSKSKTRMQVHHAADTKPREHRPSWLAVRSILARQDTLRSQAIAHGRRQAEERARAEIDQKVAERAALKTGPGADELVRRLRIIEETLGARIDWSDRSGPTPYGCIDLETLGRLAVAARAEHGLERALDRLGGRYNLDPVRRALTDLDKAITAVRTTAEQVGADA